MRRWGNLIRSIFIGIIHVPLEIRRGFRDFIEIISSLPTGLRIAVIVGLKKTLIRLGIVGLVLGILIGIGALAYSASAFPPWVGLAADPLPPSAIPTSVVIYQQDKTLWDWLQLLLVPLVLAFGGFWLTRAENRYALELQERREKEAQKLEDQRIEEARRIEGQRIEETQKLEDQRIEEARRIEGQRIEETQKLEDQRIEEARRIESERAKDAALQAYLDQMTDLLLHEKLLISEEKDSVRTVARARTLTVVKQLDGARKARVVQFLYEARLIGYCERQSPQKPTYIKAVVSLSGLDLQEANLTEVNLDGANLTETDLSRINLSFANLIKADLSFANLTHAHLQGANLYEANLYEADLPFANLTDARLRGANFDGANLTDADFTGADFTGTDFTGAIGLPDYLKHRTTPKP
jgi:hypothetical protein